MVVGLLELTLGILDARELTQRSVGKDDRARQLADDLLHRLTHPPHRVPPERHAAVWLVALERAQEADDALLHQFFAVNDRPAVRAGDAGNQRGKPLYKLITIPRAARLGPEDQRPVGGVAGAMVVGSASRFAPASHRRRPL